MKVLLVNKDTLEIMYRYEDDSLMAREFGGDWGNPHKTVRVQCSDAYDWDCVVVEYSNGAYIAHLDAELEEAKDEVLWIQVRQERSRRLAECDWTQLADAPLNSQDKTAWAEYRQALRDIPEENEDPREIEWPAQPNVQI